MFAPFEKILSTFGGVLRTPPSFVGERVRQELRANFQGVLMEDKRFSSPLLDGLTPMERRDLLTHIHPSDYFEDVEVFDPCHLISMGDANGSLGAVISNMCAAGVVDPESLEIYPGGGRKLIFLGDILADRVQQGTQCLRFIQLLKKAEYEVHCLIGNHDQWGLAYLFPEAVKQKVTWDMELNLSTPYLLRIAKESEYAAGLMEFSKYAPKQTRDLGKDMYTLLEQHQEDILAHLRVTIPPWYEGITELFAYFYYDVETGSLFLHTPPTEDMLMVVISALEEKNYYFTLEMVLQRSMMQNFAELFANTSVRCENIYEPKLSPQSISAMTAETLRICGVQRIVCGHDSMKESDITHFAPALAEAGIHLINIDGSSWKASGAENNRSLLGIKEDTVHVRKGVQ